MELKSKYKVDATFSMSSMTDIVFLLLIFFMLTSSFITPSGIAVNLPSSKSSKIVMQKVTVSISKDLEYYVNDKKTTAEGVEALLTAALNGVEEGVVVLHIDKSVPTEHLVKVAGIAASLKAKVSVATLPN